MHTMQWRMYCCECAEGSVPISCGGPPRPRTTAASLECADIGHRPRRWWGGEDEDTLANSNLLASHLSTPSIHNIQYMYSTHQAYTHLNISINETGGRVMFSISIYLENVESRYLSIHISCVKWNQSLNVSRFEIMIMILAKHILYLREYDPEII